MTRVLTLSLVILLFFCAFSAFATTAKGFYIPENFTSCSKVTALKLCVQGDFELSAFVLDLDYDSDALSFRGVKSKIRNSFFSVNDSSEGEIKVSFLCKEGADCTIGTELLEIEFKVFKTSQVNYSVSQAINKNAEDISVNLSGTAKITAYSKGDNSLEGSNTENNEASEVSLAESASQRNTDNAVIKIEKSKNDDSVKVFIVVFALMALFVGAASFIAGRYIGKNNKDRR